MDQIVEEVQVEESPEAQCAALLKHLREIGPITALQAEVLYGIGRTAARVYDLRQKLRPIGQDINSKRVPRQKANGKTARVAMYWLEA